MSRRTCHTESSVGPPLPGHAEQADRTGRAPAALEEEVCRACTWSARQPFPVDVVFVVFLLRREGPVSGPGG